jgi:hypothetical protein
VRDVAPALKACGQRDRALDRIDAGLLEAHRQAALREGSASEATAVVDRGFALWLAV